MDLERKLADIPRIEHNLGYNANGGWMMIAYYNASSKLSMLLMSKFDLQDMEKTIELSVIYFIKVWQECNKEDDYS